MTDNPDGLVSISFAWSWKSKDVTDLSIDGLYLDEYESDDLFVAVRDALTEWLTPSTPENTATHEFSSVPATGPRCFACGKTRNEHPKPENTASPDE